MREFEVIRKTAENIFFVAHRQNEKRGFCLVFCFDKICDLQHSVKVVPKRYDGGTSRKGLGETFSVKRAPQSKENRKLTKVNLRYDYANDEGRERFESSHSDQNEKRGFCLAFCFDKMCDLQHSVKVVPKRDDGGTSRKGLGETFSVKRAPQSKENRKLTKVNLRYDYANDEGRERFESSHSDQNEKRGFCLVFCFAV